MGRQIWPAADRFETLFAARPKICKSANLPQIANERSCQESFLRDEEKIAEVVIVTAIMSI